MMEILVADDEPAIRVSVEGSLRHAGHHVQQAADGALALELLTAQRFDLVISDIRMPKVDGLEIFRRVRGDYPETDIMLMTAYGAVEEAVSALKQGACDYLLKPFDLDELVVRVSRIDALRTLKRELRLAQSAQPPPPGTEIIGRAPSMVRLLERIATIAHSDAAVLITGETGTGKELVARRIHELSARRHKPLIAINCASFPETLLEGELFGHERGAFTGAVKRRDGLFKAADGGTLFLDEIAEMSLPAQAKLLRVLQEGVFTPLGTNTPVHVDVRVIAATNRALRKHVAEGRFREDLFYRLNVLDVAIPPLRERRADLPVLVEHFLRALTPTGRRPPLISPPAWAALSEYAFPGNVRELRHAIERAIVLCPGEEIDLSHLPPDVAGAGREPAVAAHSGAPSGPLRPLAIAMKEFEHEYLLRALHAAAGRKGQTADLLGISRKSLWEKLRSHNINADDPVE